MRHSLIVTLGLTLIASSPAWAARLHVSLKAPASAVQAHRERRGLQPGMAVVDRRGAKIGLIVAVSQTRGGLPAVLVEDNGARFTIRDRNLRLSRRDDVAITRLTRSQLRTRAILNTG